jgi:hypothetical protein
MVRLLASVCGAILIVGQIGIDSCSASEVAHRVHVRILQHESSIRTSVGNRDAYVVRVEPKNGNEFKARIVDEYPGYLDPPVISFDTDDASPSVALRRAPYCDSDVPGQDGTDQIRCFEVVHGSWRTPKSAKEEWWK